MPKSLTSELESLALLAKGHLPVAVIAELAARLAEPGRMDDVAAALNREPGTLVPALRAYRGGKTPAADRLVAALLQRLSEVGSVDGSMDNTEALPPGPRDESPPVLLHLDAFRIQKVLGQGGMGMVYLADDPRLGRQVAIKTLKRELAEKPGAVDRFLREARTAAQVEHDHICPIYQVGEDNGTPFIAMPFLKGEPLNALLKREKPLSVPDVLRIGREIALGLAAAHGVGLIHRDIKPANVWLETGRGRNPRVRILDFGLARAQAAEGEITASGAILGTPAYMAPEQARGKNVDARADLWSLGVILYEMATGQRPFTGEDTMAILTSLALDNPPPATEVNPGVPLALSALVTRLLSKNPAGRPASGQEVADEIQQIQIHATLPMIEAMPAPPLPPSHFPPPPPAAADPFGGFDDSAMGAAPAAPISVKMKRAAAKSAPAPRGFPWPLAAGVGLVVLLGGGFAAYKLAIQAKTGTLVVETDAEADARFKTGKLELYTEAGDLKYTLAPGETNMPIAAGKYVAKVAGADGVKLDADTFTMEKGGKAVVRLTADRPAVVVAKKPAPKPDPKPTAKLAAAEADRRATEYGLSAGGRARISRTPFTVTAVADIPKAGHQLNGLNLTGRKQVTDAGLATLRDCRTLAHLRLEDTPVTDAGLAHLKDVPTLVTLGLAGTRVTDAGLAHLAGAADLTDLTLGNTAVTAAGLGHLKECKKLMALRLDGTAVGPEAVPALAGFERLLTLDVRGTKLPPPSIQRLAEKLPQCRITHDGGTLEPAPPADPDRAAAEYAVAAGGVVALNDEQQYYTTVVSLPKAPFTLTSWDAGDARRVCDGGLAAFRHCKNLTRLNLNYTAVTDAGLANFQSATGLTALSLIGADITDAGLTVFKDCKRLDRVELASTPVTDAGLAVFKTCKHMAVLNVGFTKVSNASLPVLLEFKALIQLHVQSCNMTAAATPALAAGLPDCRIMHGNKSVEPAPADPDRVAAAYVLTAGGVVSVNGDPRVITASADLPPPPFTLTAVVLNTNRTATAAGLSHFKGTKNLRAVNLAAAPVSDAALSNFDANAKLRDLVVSGTSVSDVSVPVFARFPELTALDAHYTRVTAEGARKLAALLPRCKIGHDGEVIDAAEAAADRKAAEYTVFLGGAVRLNSGVRDVKAAIDLPKTFRLAAVLFAGNKQVTDAGLAVFKDCRNLRTVDLADTMVTDAGLAHFAAATGLESLDLAGTAAGDDGLAALAGCDRLWRLDLTGTRVTDAGLPTLKGFTDLERLQVRKTKLTAEAVKKLAEALPKCRIEHDGGVIEPK